MLKSPVTPVSGRRSSPRRVLPARTALIVAVATLLATQAVARPLRAASADRPNIVFIFADDQCFDTIRALGNEEVETPNLDAIARRGTTFTHTYNMGSWSGAVCVASRTMLNTGRFIWRANAVYATSEKERQAGRFWSEYLKRAGYETYMTGKWHVRANAERAFDVTRHVRGGMPKQTEAGYNRPIDGQPDPWSPSDPKFGGFWEGGKHWSEVVGDNAVEFLQRASGRDAPFFMYLAFNAPHDPRQSPQEYVDKYPLEEIRVPENFLPEYPYNEAAATGRKLRDERLAPFPRTARAVKVHRQEYYAIISHMDTQVGRILEAIHKTGKADNTYIFFTADHGLAVGQHGLFGKQNMYDHSVRVPFMVIGPGIDAGGKIATPIYLQDVMPTTLDLAGVQRPDHVEFKSLLPLLRGQRTTQYESIYGAYLQAQRMITHDGYKLILYPKVQRFRLYHVAKDPLEKVDLAADPGQQERIKALYARLKRLQADLDDAVNLDSDFPALAAGRSE